MSFGNASTDNGYGDGGQDSNNNGPGGSGSGDKNQTVSSGYESTVTTITIGISASVFRVTCWGMKPNTLHRAFLLSTDVSVDCAPIVALDGGAQSQYSYGSPLVSGSDGRLVFDYAFKPTNSPFSTTYLADYGQTVAIIPYGLQSFKVSSDDGNSYAQSFIESK